MKQDYNTNDATGDNGCLVRHEVKMYAVALAKSLTGLKLITDTILVAV
jgi:hypothetical protein